MDRHPDRVESGQTPRRLWHLLALAGVLIGVAGRLELIRVLGTVLPYRDQWKATGIDLIAPWLEGRLEWATFMAPLNDHWIVLTRLLSFGLLWINGQWNNLLEVAVNTAILAAGAFLFLRTVAPALGPRLGAWWIALAGLVLALPVTWENTLWGIQSLVFFQVALSLAYIWSASIPMKATRGWWLAQAAGGLVLLTQQSSILVHVTVALVLAWRLWRSQGNRRMLLAGAGLCAGWIAFYFFAAPDFTVTASLKADSWRTGLDLFLRQLGWPRAHPGWAFLFYLPWLWLVARRIHQKAIHPAEIFILGIGLWVGAQAAAIGYGRGGDLDGFVSRYCDFLIIGFLVNAACLARLWITRTGKLSALVIVSAAITWLGCAAPGFWHESFHEHAGHALLNRETVNAQNLASVGGYLSTGDAAFLSRDRNGDALAPYPDEIAKLLDSERFRALLPPETGAVGARPDHGRIGFLGDWLPRSGLWLGLIGTILLPMAAFRLHRFPNAVADGPAEATEASSPRIAAIGCTVAAVGSMALLFAWPQPLEFNEERRWTEAFAPARVGVSFFEPSFTQQGSGPLFLHASTIGAIETIRPLTAPHWRGSRIGGTDFTGILASQEFEVRNRFFATPVTGWPAWPGNGLRWRFREPSSGAIEWVSFDDPNPILGISVWTIDARPFAGWQASLFLFDGRTDAEGWLGVSRPALFDDPEFGPAWSIDLRTERTEATHGVVAGCAAISTIAAAISWVLLARGRRREPA